MFHAIHQLQFIREVAYSFGMNGFNETTLNQSKYPLDFISFRPTRSTDLKRPKHPMYPTHQARLIDFLPKSPSHPFTSVDRPINKPYPPKMFTYPSNTHDQVIFKTPLPITRPTNPKHIGSLESISSGYYSDGLPVGMGNIRKWLKSLRLHKYGWVFDCVSYETMFSFDEEHLERLKITQGARTKLANCIAKLETRYETMKQIELILSQNEMYVPEAIHEMESMIDSPMKPMRINCDKDVGYQLWKVLNIGEFLLCFSF